MSAARSRLPNRRASTSFNFECGLLLLRRNHSDPLVVLPWRTWASLLGPIRR